MARQDPTATNRPTHMPSIEQCARTGRPFIDLPYEPDHALRKVLSYFIANYNHLNVERAEALCFYTDYRYYQLHGEPFTDTDYYPESHGMVAPIVIKELETSPYREGTSFSRGSKKRSFSCDKVSLAPLDDSLVAFLDQILTETRTVSDSNLHTFSRNTPAYEHTPYETAVEFSDRTVEEL